MKKKIIRILSHLIKPIIFCSLAILVCRITHGKWITNYEGIFRNFPTDKLEKSKNEHNFFPLSLSWSFVSKITGKYIFVSLKITLWKSRTSSFTMYLLQIRLKNLTNAKQYHYTKERFGKSAEKGHYINW